MRVGIWGDPELGARRREIQARTKAENSLRKEKKEEEMRRREQEERQQWKRQRKIYKSD